MATQPRTISQKIELIGEREIARALEAAGKAGEKAFAQTSAEIAKLSRNLNQVVNVVASVENAFSRLGRLGAQIGFGGQIPTLVQGINDFERAVGRALRNTGLLAAGLTAAGAGVVKFAAGAVKTTDELGENAAAAGLNAEEYQKLQFALESAGVKTTQFQQIMARLVDQFEDARKRQADFRRAADADVTSFRSAVDPSKIITKTDEEVKKLFADVTDLRNIFTRLGIDVSRGGLFEAVQRVAGELSKLPTDLARIQAGVDTLGVRGGARFAAALASLPENLQRIAKEFDLLGLKEEQVKIGDQTSTSLDVLSRVAKNVRTQLGLVFSDSLKEGAEEFTRAIVALFPTLRDFAQFLGKQVNSALKDFINLLKGEDEKVENKFILDARDRVVAFGESVKRVVDTIVRPALRALVAAFEAAAAGINRLFGTSLSAADLGILVVLGKLTGAFGLVESGAKLALSAVATFFQGILAGAAVLGILGAIAGWPATAAAAFVAAAILIIGNWEQVKTLFREFGIELEAIDRILRDFSETTGTDVFSGLASTAERASQAFATLSREVRENGLSWKSLGDFLRTVDPDLARILDLVDKLAAAVARLKNLRQLPLHDDQLNAQVQADATNELARQKARLSEQREATSELERQRARLGQATTQAAESEGFFARALRTTQEALAGNTRAAQENAAATQASGRAAVTISRDFAAGSKTIEDFAKQSEQAKNVVSSIELKGPARDAAALGKNVKDLAQPFRTIRDEAGGVKDLATPVRTLGDEAVKAAGGVGQLEQSTGKLKPKILDIKAALDQATQAGQGLPAVAQQIADIDAKIKSIGTAPAPAGPAVAGAATPAAAGAVGGPFANLVTQAQQAKDAILALFSGLGGQIATAIGGGGAAGAAIPGAIPAAGAAPAAEAAPGGAFGFLVTQAQQAVTAIEQAFAALGGSLTQAVVTGLQGLLPALSATFTQIPLLFQSVVGQIQSALQVMLAAVQTASRQAIQQLQAIVQAAQQASQAIHQAGQGQPFAAGGYTGAGPKHRPAGVVHRGEYVQPARVVRQPGVLGFMEMLRRTGDLQGVIQRFTRSFDIGGLVGPMNVSPKLAYAGGGMVSGGQVGRFVFEDARGRTIATMSSDAANAESLIRFANLRNAASGGRKPQRYGGR